MPVSLNVPQMSPAWRLSGDADHRVQYEAGIQNDSMQRAWVQWRRQAERGYTTAHRWWSGQIGKPGWRELPPDEWEPPIRPVPGKGYPRICVEFEGFVFQFISTFEMREVASALDRPLIDRASSQQRWYRTLPASVKSKHARHRAAGVVMKAAAAYEAQLPSLMKERAPIPQEAGLSLAPDPVSRLRL
jgi:hypothetical protein